MSDRLKHLGCITTNTTTESADCDPCKDLCSPPQPLPPSMTSFDVSPDNIIVAHTCGGAVSNEVDRCTGQGIETFTQWVTWVEENIISWYCESKSAPCNLSVSEDNKIISKPIGKVLADCLGMSETKPHIVFDPVSKTAVAGLIDLGDLTCPQFQNLLKTCPPVATADQSPYFVMGYDQVTGEPKWYRFAVTRPTKFTGQQAFALSANNYAKVSADQRLLLRNTDQTYHSPEGGSWDAAQSVYTIGKSGLYRVNYSTMLNVKYTAMTGWIATVMTGILKEPATGSPVELRVDERPLYLNYTAAAGQDVILQGTVDIPLEPGDKIRPRYWFNNTYVPTGTQDRKLDIWLNRSADTHFSLYRIPEDEIVLGS